MSKSNQLCHRALPQRIDNTSWLSATHCQLCASARQTGIFFLYQRTSFALLDKLQDIIFSNNNTSLPGIQITSTSCCLCFMLCWAWFTISVWHNSSNLWKRYSECTLYNWTCHHSYFWKRLHKTFWRIWLTLCGKRLKLEKCIHWCVWGEWKGNSDESMQFPQIFWDLFKAIPNYKKRSIKVYIISGKHYKANKIP